MPFLQVTLSASGNLGLAELQGGDKDLYLLGARLRGFTSISPLYSGCGLMFSASTYADTIGLTFTSDRLMMPDPEFMRHCLDETMADVTSYLDGKKSAAKTGRRKRKAAAKRSTPAKKPAGKSRKPKAA